MTPEELKRMQWAHARGMQAMTPEQMAERERQQATGMYNAAGICPRPEDLANAWAPNSLDGASLGALGPGNMPPMTLRQRIAQRLSRFWRKE